MQYCKCTNDFVNAIIDDYFNSFKIRKDLTEGLVYEWTNSMEQIHDTGKVKRKYTYLAYTYGTYMNGNFNTCMGKLKMKHLPHDGRHTFASLMDSAGANDVCIKLIMGHSMKNDTTKGTYTHKTLEELLTEVNKI